MRAAYGKKLRVFFTDDMRLHILLDFGSVPVFKASVDTCILLTENLIPNGEPFFAATFRDAANILRLSDAFQERVFPLHVRDLSLDGWTLTSPQVLRLLERLESIGTPLGEYVDGFYRGVVTGCNDAFIIDADTREYLIDEDAGSSELIKPVLRGRHLRKWKETSANEYLIAIASSMNREWPWSDARNDTKAERIFAETYPVIYQHLSDYYDRLIAREDQGRFYWELRSCTYYDKFEKSKIVYRRIATSLDASYDTKGTFGLDTTFFIPTTELALLAILNSKLFDWYARHKVLPLNDPWAGGGLQFFAQYMEKVPIVDMTSEQRTGLSYLVNQILADPESDSVREMERKIDQLVYQLYGLTDAEIEFIKQTYLDAGMEV